jgi:hypothetical protein
MYIEISGVISEISVLKDWWMSTQTAHQTWLLCTAYWQRTYTNDVLNVLVSVKRYGLIGIIICEISASHGGEFEDDFFWDVAKVVSTSETSVNFYHTTRRNIPEDRLLSSGLSAV